MDEIFGEQNFVATVIWHKMDSPKNTAIQFSEDHDYLVVYARDASLWRPNKPPRSEAMVARYKNPDNDPRGPWLLSDLAARNFCAAGRYPITTPSGRVIAGPPAGSYWRVSRERFDELERDGRIWWGKSGGNRPGMKRFLSELAFRRFHAAAAAVLKREASARAIRREPCVRGPEAKTASMTVSSLRAASFLAKEAARSFGKQRDAHTCTHVARAMQKAA